MAKWLRFLLIGLLIFGLILVRAFEDDLFYDPFLEFFKGDYLHNPMPEYDLTKVGIHIVFRYLLNSILSLGIIWLLFLDTRKLKFTVLVLTGFLMILLPLYLYMVSIDFKLGENTGFYIRRFLIQPMILLVLIPAFYYHDWLDRQKQK
ncbi:MAG: exosortase F system-associated protein [Moheibacter sp.]